MLMHIKDKFKNDPKTYNHFEMNLKNMYRDKVRRERKLKIKKPGEEEGDEDPVNKEAPDLFKQMTSVKSKASFSVNCSIKSPRNAPLTQTFNNNPLEKYGVISMVDYINQFTKQHNISLKIEKNRFPIEMFMDVPKNTVFYTYKKRRLFNEVVETVDNLKRRLDTEE